jgi:hypothetical protein
MTNERASLSFAAGQPHDKAMDGDRPQALQAPGAGPAGPAAHSPAAGGTPGRPAAGRRAQVKQLIQAIRDADEAAAQDAVIRLSQARRLFAPAAFAVGAVAMLFTGLKLLFSNWRLTLVQVLPAMWIWAAMYDLKAHLLHGKSFHVLTGWLTIPIVLAIALITAASFLLNAVFAFAITRPGRPEIRPALNDARRHLGVILGWGMAVGLCLGVSTIIVTRWGPWWFAISLSVVLAVMMVCYVAVPARIVGVRAKPSRRDKLAATIIAGTLGALVCAPGYILGRIGLIVLGSSTLLILGVILFSIGLVLQAGTTGAVKAIKMSAKLIPRQQGADDPPGPGDPLGPGGPPARGDAPRLAPG